MISKYMPELRKTTVQNYRGIDLKSYRYRLFRGKPINENQIQKYKKIIYKNKFIYGFNLEKHDELYLQEDGDFWCSKVNQYTLGIRANINGYRKKKHRNKFIKIMLFEGDIVKLHCSDSVINNGFIGTIKIINGEFFATSVCLDMKLKNIKTTEFWEVIGNNAGINDRSNSLIILED